MKRIAIGLVLAWCACAMADADADLRAAHERERAGQKADAVAGYAGVGWKPSDKWSLYARFTAWHTDGWDSRIVYYEQGVSQSFPVETYSGKGTGEYLVVKYSPSKRFEMQLKLQQGYCAYFVRIFIPGRMMLLAFRPLSL